MRSDRDALCLRGICSLGEDPFGKRRSDSARGDRVRPNTDRAVLDCNVPRESIHAPFDAEPMKRAHRAAGACRGRGVLKGLGIVAGVAGVTTKLNGVDLEKVERLTERYRQDPASGLTGFAARVRWLGGYRTESALGEHGPVRGDEPVDLAGTDTGPTPEEMLLGAVGQCLAVGYAGAAAARGIRIDSLEIDVKGEVNLPVAYGVQEGNPGFDRIEVNVRLESDAPREELEALHKKVVERAPIPNTVARPVQVDTKLA